MEIKFKKRILLASANFYSYPDIIAKALIDLGYEVEKHCYPKKRIYMPVFPKSKFILLRQIYALFKNDFDDFGKYCEKQHDSLKFDYLLSINTPLSKQFLNKLKKEHTNYQ